MSSFFAIGLKFIYFHKSFIITKKKVNNTSNERQDSVYLKIQNLKQVFVRIL